MAIQNPTKGWIKNKNTGAVKPFMYNPTGLAYSRSATYTETASPGSPYPMTNYVRGNATEFPVALLFHDVPYSGKILEYLAFFNALLPSEIPDSDYEVPPELVFSMGYYVRTCVLTSMDVAVDQFTPGGNPMVATITLNLRQVGL
jgi:hypothetical protein